MEGIPFQRPEPERRYAPLRILIGVVLIPAAIALVCRDFSGMTSMHVGIMVGWTAFFLLAYPTLSKKTSRILWVIIAAVITTFAIPPVAMPMFLQGAVKAEIPLPAITPIPIQNKIFLFERYGGEWHTSNDEPIIFKKSGSFLSNRFGEGRTYRFTPTIYNGNRQVVIANPVQLYIELPNEIVVEPTKLWVHTDSGNTTQTHFASIPSEIPPGAGMTINESLFLKFKRAGRYEARYFIKGRTTTGEGFEPVVGTFEFVLE